MIKKALAAALPGLIGLAVLPAHAGADGDYQWIIAKNECVTSGGKFGLGWLGMRAGNRKTNKIGVNYLKVRFERQYMTSTGGWRVDRTHTNQSPTFPNDAQTRSLYMLWRFPFSDIDVGKTFRMKVSYSWYKQNPGPDWRKKHVVEYGPTCSVGDPTSLG